MSTDTPDNPIEQQKAVFDEFWLRFSKQIENKEGVVDFPSHAEMKPTHTTTVVRLPIELTEKCARLVEKVKAAYPNHYYYPTTDMHFTLLNLDKLIAMSNGQAKPGIVTRNVQQALANLPPLKMEVCGLGLFPTTIFAKVYDVSGILEVYRNEIKNAVLKALSLSQTDAKALVEGIAFVNLVRFKYAPEPGLVKMVNDMRDIKLGTFKASQVELVETNKLLSLSETIVKSKIAINH